MLCRLGLTEQKNASCRSANQMRPEVIRRNCSCALPDGACKIGTSMPSGKGKFGFWRKPCTAATRPWLVSRSAEVRDLPSDLRREKGREQFGRNRSGGDIPLIGHELFAKCRTIELPDAKLSCFTASMRIIRWNLAGWSCRLFQQGCARKCRVRRSPLRSTAGRGHRSGHPRRPARSARKCGRYLLSCSTCIRSRRASSGPEASASAAGRAVS